MDVPSPGTTAEADQTHAAPARASRSASATAPSSTRERILDIALELFIVQGYEATSLRDIAERLGTTKAAVYYHFQHKQDMLLELHLRLHALGRDALEQLEDLADGTARADAFPMLLDYFIDQVMDNRDLVLLHQRNLNAFEQLMDDERHQAENEDFEQQFRRILQSPDIPIERRIRMLCALSAVVGALISGDSIFTDLSLPALAEHVRRVAHDILASSEPST